MKYRTIPLVLLVIFAIAGCARSASGPYSAGSERTRDIEKAESLYQKAMVQVKAGDSEAGEQLLRQALDADLYHGRAHNNLGVVLLEQGRLYDAAIEFTWARRLLPGHPDPRVNLALALWQGGQIDQALAACDAALEVQQDYLPAVQAAAVIRVQEGLDDERTLELLATLQRRSVDQAWAGWATRQAYRIQP